MELLPAQQALDLFGELLKADAFTEVNWNTGVDMATGRPIAFETGGTSAALRSGRVALLAASSVPRIAYVSCNPATFARDAAALAAGGYRLDWVKPVGQFRWSTHVELASRFSRE